MAGTLDSGPGRYGHQGVPAARPAAAAPTAPLSAWLEAHGLTYGLADYWNSARDRHRITPLRCAQSWDHGRGH